MIKNMWCVLCQKILTDKDTNLVSHINCVDSLTVKGKFPVHIVSLSLSTCWKKNKVGLEIFKIKLLYKLPSGKQEEIFISGDIAMEKQTHRVNFVIDGFEVKEEGKNELIIEYYDEGKWKNADTVFLHVSLDKKF